MGNADFDPWLGRADLAPERRLGKRLDPAQAEEIAGEIARMEADESTRGALQLALLRNLVKTLSLEPEAGSERGPQLRRLLTGGARRHVTHPAGAAEAAVLALEAGGTGDPDAPSDPAEPPEASSGFSAKEVERRIEAMGGGAACPDSYRPYVLGRFLAATGDPGAAARNLSRALGLERRDEGRAIILLALLPVRWRLGQAPEPEREAQASPERETQEALEREAQELLDIGGQSQGNPYAIATAQLYRALLLTDREEWNASAEAGRAASYHFFRFGAQQASRLVAASTYLTARGLFEQNEWHETSLLAGLSLKGFQRWEGRPGRADALLLLAKAARRHGDLDRTRQSLSYLFEHIAEVPGGAQLEAEARALESALPAP